MNNFKVVAYYTLNTPYEEEVENLRSSLKYFNIDHHIKGIQNLGNWYRNTQYKANFIQEMLDKFKGQDLLYTDADSIIRQSLVLFKDIECDIAVRYLKWKYNKLGPDGQLASGTIYFSNNDKVKEVVRRWIGKHKGESKLYDQVTLQQVISDCKKELGLVVYKLPIEYCEIHKGPFATGKPVIEHFQSSRRFKRIVGSKSCFQNKK